MDHDFPNLLMDALHEVERRKLGLDSKNPGEIFLVVHKIVEVLPAVELQAYAVSLAATGRESDKLKSEQIGILLFCQAEMKARLLSRSPKEMLAMMREITATPRP